MIPLMWSSSTGKIIYGVYTLFAELSLQSYDWEGTQGKIWGFWKYLNIDLGGDYPRVYVKSYPAIHLRLVQFTAFNLYLNKELKKKEEYVIDSFCFCYPAFFCPFLKVINPDLPLSFTFTGCRQCSPHIYVTWSRTGHQSFPHLGHRDGPVI